MIKKLLVVFFLLSSPLYAGGWLKQSTATTIRIGPFVKIADGTVDNSQTVTNFTVKLIPHSDATGVVVTSFSPTASGGSNDSVFAASGMYELELTAANTATAGRFDVVVTTSGTACYPAFDSFMVVGPDRYDSITDVATIQDLRVEMDTNSIKLVNLDTNVGSRMQETSVLTIPQNTAYNNFAFRMFNSSGTALTGLTVTCQVAKDGAALATCTNSVSEVGGGVYKIDLAAADLTVTYESYFIFTATGARSTEFKINVQR